MLIEPFYVIPDPFVRGPALVNTSQLRVAAMFTAGPDTRHLQYLQYLLNIYTVSTQHLHSIYTVSTPPLRTPGPGTLSLHFSPHLHKVFPAASPVIQPRVSSQICELSNKKQIWKTATFLHISSMER